MLVFIWQNSVRSLNDQVLPRENGVRYPWNFLFKNCFWRKKSMEAKHNGRISKLGNDTVESAVEAINLDMKQQELDNRYGH